MTRSYLEFSIQIKEKVEMIEKPNEWESELYWKKKAGQMIARQNSELKRKIQTQITELELALKSSPPNLEISLAILGKIERILGEK